MDENFDSPPRVKIDSSNIKYVYSLYKFFNDLTTLLVFTKLHIISYSLNPLLDATDNVSTQKYYVKGVP